MFTSLDVIQSAQAMSRHAAKQQAIVAENIAHANTPGFKAMTMPAYQPDATGMAQNTGRAGSRDKHFLIAHAAPSTTAERDAEAQLSPNGNSVSIETEMLKSIDAERQHKRAMTVYRSTLTILRASIGRS